MTETIHKFSFVWGTEMVSIYSNPESNKVVRVLLNAYDITHEIEEFDKLVAAEYKFRINENEIDFNLEEWWIGYLTQEIAKFNLIVVGDDYYLTTLYIEKFYPEIVEKYKLLEEPDDGHSR